MKIKEYIISFLGGMTNEQYAKNRLYEYAYENMLRVIYEAKLRNADVRVPSYNKVAEWVAFMGIPYDGSILPDEELKKLETQNKK